MDFVAITFFDFRIQLFLSALIIFVSFFLWAKNLTRPIILLTVLLQLRYFLWRGLFTLETSTAIALLATVTLYLAEFYGLVQSLFFYYQVKNPIKRIPKEPINYPTVDIFLPVVNEPIEILKRTLIGCFVQDYPKEKFNLYVLDDGNREDVKILARQMRCNYLQRDDRSHGKAGNLNSALKQTNGEYVAIFDVDHVPVRNFLKRTVGFFDDEKVAFVQTTHHFYNPDIFQKKFRLEKEIRNEQDLFFKVIQPGRDAHNSAFFAGSSGIFRRSALVEVGGFLTDTVTEDIHTSLKLHSRGWKSCYLNEILSAGLSPESLRGYLMQRQRWAIGGIRILLTDNPLFKKGLSISQRISYFASTFYFFHGIPRIVYLVAPLSFLLFGISAINARPLDLVHYFFSYYLLSILLMDRAGRGYRRVFWSDIYETIMSFSLTKALINAIFFHSKQRFHVTPKGELGESRIEWQTTLPQIILFVIVLVGIARGAMLRPIHSGPLLINMFWAIFNTIILLLAIVLSLEVPQRRGLIRLKRRIKCEVLGLHKKAMGYTHDISEEGASVTLEEEFYFTEPEVFIEFKSSYGETTRLEALICRQEKSGEGVTIAMKFKDVDEHTYQSLVSLMYSSPESWVEEERKRLSIKDMLLPVLGLVASRKKNRPLNRLYPRLALQTTCHLIASGAKICGSTVDVSYSGLSILIENPEYNIYNIENAEVEIEGICLDVAVVGVENIKGNAKLRLKIKAIRENEERWKNLTLL